MSDYYAIELVEKRIVHKYVQPTSNRTVCNMHLDDCAWFIDDRADKKDSDEWCPTCYPSD